MANYHEIFSAANDELPLTWCQMTRAIQGPRVIRGPSSIPRKQSQQRTIETTMRKRHQKKLLAPYWSLQNEGNALWGYVCSEGASDTWLKILQGRGNYKLLSTSNEHDENWPGKKSAITIATVAFLHPEMVGNRRCSFDHSPRHHSFSFEWIAKEEMKHKFIHCACIYRINLNSAEQKSETFEMN